MQFNSREEAIRSAQEFMKLHVDILGPSYEGECEVRQMFDPADFANGQGCGAAKG
jgi:hypothetical protein